ncbi:MAG: hypothetical protein FWJ85_03220 [Solitalea sp.]
MEKVISKDGTTIAFKKLGKGPALILVGGSFEQRAMDSETSRLAAQRKSTPDPNFRGSFL